MSDPVRTEAQLRALPASALPLSRRIRALIVDDEPPARRRLRMLLQQERDVEIAGECGEASAAAVLVRELSPDVVFLDVRMPDGDGFELVDTLGVDRMPVTVFVTAYHEFALRAFDAAAIDYLLKPFDRERFAATMHRVRRAVTRTDVAAERAADAAAAPYLERIAVRNGNRIRILHVDEIDHIAAEGNYVRLFTRERSFLERETLNALESRLDPRDFARVHRSAIVRIDRVREVEPLFHGEYVLILAGGAKVVSGRSYRARVQEALQLER